MGKLKIMNLKGKVKSVKESSGKVSLQTCQPASYITYYFNLEGVLTKSVSSRLSLGSSYESITECDDNERIIKTAENEDGKQISIRAFKYHKNGKIAKIEYTTPGDDSKIEETDIENKTDEQFMESLFAINDNSFSRNITKYDSSGNKIEGLSFDKNNKMESKETFKYDENNHLMEHNSICYSVFNTRIEKKLFTYDSNGNKIESLSFDGDKKLNSKVLTKYNSDNRAIEMEYIYFDENGNISSNEVEKMNYRHKTKTKIIDQKYSYTFEYDNNENWIVKKKLNTKKELVHTYKREIKYY